MKWTEEYQASKQSWKQRVNPLGEGEERGKKVKQPTEKRWEQKSSTASRRSDDDDYDYLIT